MELINKKNFLPTVCVIYTIISLAKIVLEYAAWDKMGNDERNFIMIFLLSIAATFVLSLQYRLQKFPVLLVMAGQYVALITVIMLFTWISGFFSKLHPDAYRDMFWSFTIPYVIFASLYYISLFMEMKKANKIIMQLQEGEK